MAPSARTATRPAPRPTATSACAAPTINGAASRTAGGASSNLPRSPAGRPARRGSAPATATCVSACWARGSAWWTTERRARLLHHALGHPLLRGSGGVNVPLAVAAVRAQRQAMLIALQGLDDGAVQGRPFSRQVRAQRVQRIRAAEGQAPANRLQPRHHAAKRVRIVLFHAAQRLAGRPIGVTALRQLGQNVDGARARGFFGASGEDGGRAVPV